MIEVSYHDGAEWKSSKTTKLCKLLERVFGKNADILGDKSECYLKHISGQSDYYDVVKWTSSGRGNCVGKIYIGYYDEDEFPEDFFEDE